METFHPPKDTQACDNNNVLREKEGISEKWLREKLDNLIPLIQEKWPNLASQTIKATKGSIDELVNVIEKNTGNSNLGIKKQLFEIIDSIQANNWEITEQIEPIETQLEELLDELNQTLRPKIESPIRQKPILSIAIAAGIGLIIGSLINTGRK
tara:strand:- start:1788 stop:2249 length:462 start_codon:yes stop_codon:yes gene_type:complete